MITSVIRRSAAVLLFCALVVSMASAATFTVTSSGATGPGSLEQAILDANANPGRDQIVFTVSAVSSEPTLPAITDAVDIDGSGAEVGAGGPFCDGCALFEFAGGSSGSTIRGLRLTDPAYSQIQVSSGVSGVLIRGIFLSGAIRVFGDNNVLGGTTPADALLSSFSAITFGGGTGNQLLGSAVTEVRVTFASRTVIRNNRISAGVSVDYATGVEITGNTTAHNAAIHLGSHDGDTPNDAAPDADTGANDLQNFPVLTSAYRTPGVLTVAGTLTSAPLTPYQIELFSSPIANRSTRVFLGSFMVTTDATGNATFTQTITTSLPAAGEFIVSTATNRGAVPTPGNTPNSTSEVSAPLAVTQPGVVGLSATTYTVDEGAGTVAVTVQRTDGSEGTVTVDYATSNGTATAPADYSTASGTLTFGPGVTTQSFMIPIVEDALPEAGETFTVTLTGPTGGATLGTATATITVTDNDPLVAATPVPTASEWALITMALALALIGFLRR